MLLTLQAEFDRQVTCLIAKNYHQLSTLSKADFLQELEELRRQLPEHILPEFNTQKGTLPFVLVVKSTIVPSNQAMERVEKEGKNGVSKLFPFEPHDFSPTTDVEIPEGNFYLLLDIDRGQSSLNVAPNAALPEIKRTGCSPLTIDEGIAIVTQFPEFLVKNNCFSLLGSRHAGSQHVPAIWIDGEKRPKLGWCWDGNPHTWLGSASAVKRIGIDRK